LQSTTEQNHHSYVDKNILLNYTHPKWICAAQILHELRGSAAVKFHLVYIYITKIHYYSMPQHAI